MAFYQLKMPTKAITFEELVKYGRENGGNIVDGMPWEFSYQGRRVSRESDERYLVVTQDGPTKVGPGDLIATLPDGHLLVVTVDQFLEHFERIGE